MKHAVMSIDPGTTTGVACFLFSNEGTESIEGLSWFELPSPSRPSDASRYVRFQRSAERLFQLWNSFRQVAVRVYQISPKYHQLVSEDFNIRTLAADLSPVYVSMLLQGIRQGVALGYERQGIGPASVPDIFWSSPAIREAFPDAGLKQAKLWIPGKDHARSAIRHGLARGRALGYHELLSARKRPPAQFFSQD